MREASFKLPTVESDIWEDISEFTDPLGFLKIILRWGRRFREGRNMSPEAADKFDDLLMAGYLDLVRDLTEEESARVKNLLDQGDLL